MTAFGSTNSADFDWMPEVDTTVRLAKDPTGQTGVVTATTDFLITVRWSDDSVQEYQPAGLLIPA